MYDDQTEVPMVNPNPGSWIWGKYPCAYCEGHTKGWCGTARVL